MGNCASCLGRKSDAIDEDDESRLLFDDPNGMHYGSFGDQQMNDQDDPVEAQREIEALQRVVARTSDNMVDIFEIAPPDNSGTPTRAAVPSAFAFAGQEAHQVRYQNLLSKLSSDDDDLVATMAGARVEWLPQQQPQQQEDDDIELHDGIPPVKIEAGEPLVGNFADAAAAMA